MLVLVEEVEVLLTSKGKRSRQVTMIGARGVLRQQALRSLFCLLELNKAVRQYFMVLVGQDSMAALSLTNVTSQGIAIMNLVQTEEDLLQLLVWGLVAVVIVSIAVMTTVLIVKQLVQTSYTRRTTG